MENSNGWSNLRNFAYTGRQLLLPPKSNFQCIFPSNASSIVGSEGFREPNGGQVHHQRTSSASLLLEEQPSWLQELLDEPETPVCRGHQRSSSDSIACLDGATKAFGEDGYKFKNIPAGASRGSPNFDHHKDLSHASFYANSSTSDTQQKRVCESSFTSVTCSNSLLSTSDGISFQKSGSSCPPQEPDGLPFKAIVKKDGAYMEGSSIRRDCFHPNPSASRTDSKRPKQQFTQQSWIRKLQYIDELERNVQALQAEGYEVSAALVFLDQQKLILGMENMALKQRLESLSQERFIKHLEHDMLQREIIRLRCLYDQQQQQQQQSTRR
ncbi:hypothetical protein SLA2020_420750 [Shorea laevis]